MIHHDDIKRVLRRAEDTAFYGREDSAAIRALAQGALAQLGRLAAGLSSAPALTPTETPAQQPGPGPHPTTVQAPTSGRRQSSGINVAIASFVERYVALNLPHDMGFGDRTADNPDGMQVDMIDLRTIRVRMVPVKDAGPRYFRIRISEEL